MIYYLLILITSSSAVILEENETANFEKSKVYRVLPRTADHLVMLESWDNLLGVDFWTWPSLNTPTDVLVQLPLQLRVENLLRQQNISYSILIKNVQKVINQQKQEEISQFRSRNQNHNMDWTSYHDVEDINDYLFYLENKYPDVAKVFTLEENSSEGREIIGITIGTGNFGIFLEGGMHAREWISPASVTYIANFLVEDAPEYTLTNYTWYILPVANPDGYTYSRTTNRLWRKTKSNNRISSLATLASRFLNCVGVDPNRNWDYKWMDGGASYVTCSPVYAGVEPFSEAETRALSNFILENKQNIKLYLAVHSYGQLWLSPWGYTNAKPRDYRDLDKVADAAVRGIRRTHGLRFTDGPTSRTLYIASGSSVDWAKGVAGIKYSYTVEMRDRYFYGFLLPTRFIIPAAEELYQGILAAVTQIKIQDEIAAAKQRIRAKNKQRRHKYY